MTPTDIMGKRGHASTSHSAWHGTFRKALGDLRRERAQPFHIIRRGSMRCCMYEQNKQKSSARFRTSRYLDAMPGHRCLARTRRGDISSDVPRRCPVFPGRLVPQAPPISECGRNRHSEVWPGSHAEERARSESP